VVWFFGMITGLHAIIYSGDVGGGELGLYQQKYPTAINLP
jgi:hypothetical protein